MDETYSKFEGGIAVVIIVAFVMVGLGFLVVQPTYHSETRQSTVMLLPDSAPSMDWTGVGCANTWNCTNDNPPQDGNSSYIYCVPVNISTCEPSYFGLDNLSVSFSSINTVTMFSWTKRNATSVLDYGFWLAYTNIGPPGPFPECTYDDTITDGTLAYANYTSPPVPSCRGTPWSLTIINKLVIGFSIGNGTDDEVPWATTSIGVVVGYSYSVSVLDPDFNLAALLPLVLVAVAVVFVVTYIAKVRGHE